MFKHRVRVKTSNTSDCGLVLVYKQMISHVFLSSLCKKHVCQYDS